MRNPKNSCTVYNKFNVEKVELSIFLKSWFPLDPYRYTYTTLESYVISVLVSILINIDR